MALTGRARRGIRPAPPLPGEGERDYLTTLQGVAALSLDALSSVAYGPEAIVVVLIAAGTGALHATLPITLAITALLGVLVMSYRQVIAVHPDGGGAYAVAKANLGTRTSLLAAASLVVDYVLTVAVSLAAGAAALASTFTSLHGHELTLGLVGLVLLTAVNLRGITESARALMLPTVVFIVAIFAVIVVGLTRSHPETVIGTAGHVPATQTLGVLLVLRAFAAGCSALTGVEAIANGVPTFREPRVQRAQRTEVLLGVLLGLMLVGLAVLIRRDRVEPRGGVTVLAQLTAGAFGTGPAYYAVGLATTVVLLLAANTSYGGLPVLMSLLARDNRLPHLFWLRAERQVYRYGVVALALTAGVLLLAVDADTQRLIPLFAIGVFIGFTISQAGLVRHWARQRPPGWQGKAVLNGVGALLTAASAIIFLLTKFLAGAWVVVVAVPALMLLFTRIHAYYTRVSAELGLGRTPPPPLRQPSLVVVPVAGVSRLTQEALSAALALGDRVVAVSVQYDDDASQTLREVWARWDPGVPLEVIQDYGRHLIAPMVDYVNRLAADEERLAVLIPEIEPRRRRHQILQNQRGLLLATVLRTRTDAVICTLPFRL